MTIRGETTPCGAEGASVKANLSGKRTLIRRSSGESSEILEPPKGTAVFGKLSGARTETTRKNNGRSLSFFI